MTEGVCKIPFLLPIVGWKLALTIYKTAGMEHAPPGSPGAQLRNECPQTPHHRAPLYQTHVTRGTDHDNY